VVRSGRVSVTQGQFNLGEIEVRRFPELVGLRLGNLRGGNLQGGNLQVIAAAQGGRTWLFYSTVVERDAKAIIIYNKGIKRQLRQEPAKVAAQAARRVLPR
jgi:hypothetical protein